MVDEIRRVERQLVGAGRAVAIVEGRRRKREHTARPEDVCVRQRRAGRCTDIAIRRQRAAVEQGLHRCRDQVLDRRDGTRVGDLSRLHRHVPVTTDAAARAVVKQSARHDVHAVSIE